jgi:hypothetical protein
VVCAILHKSRIHTHKVKMNCMYWDRELSIPSPWPNILSLFVQLDTHTHMVLVCLFVMENPHSPTCINDMALPSPDPPASIDAIVFRMAVPGPLPAGGLP